MTRRMATEPTATPTQLKDKAACTVGPYRTVTIQLHASQSQPDGHHLGSYDCLRSTLGQRNIFSRRPVTSQNVSQRSNLVTIVGERRVNATQNFDGVRAYSTILTSGWTTNQK